MAQPQREWFEKDYYAVLGVPADAPAKDITRAYRKLAREFHPDARPGDSAAEERFKEISSAYDVLGDPDKRKSYDEARRMGAAGMGGPGGFGFDASGADLGDLLGSIFGRTRRGGSAGSPGAMRGADLETELTLDFASAVAGLTTSVHLRGEVTCTTCHGSGARPGTSPQVCTACGGRGVQADNQGLFSFSQLCSVCSGRGTVIADPCPTCSGRGVEGRDRNVKVRVPAGVEHGQRLRLSGRGGPGRQGGPAGDLYVRVNVTPHRLFGRKGRHLTLKAPVTFAEATLGAEVTVPTLDGVVTVKLPPGTASGTTLRVRGRGVPAEGRHAAGDLLVTVEVDVPTKLDKAQRKAVEALADAMGDVDVRAELLKGNGS